MKQTISSLRPVLAVERRSHWRFPLKLALRCEVVSSAQIYSGNVVDISSTGVCFSCSESFPRDNAVELVIDWPIRLNATSLLQLRIKGRVLRQDRRGTVVRTSRYGFDARRAGR
jgi:PilZ domain